MFIKIPTRIGCVRINTGNITYYGNNIHGDISIHLVCGNSIYPNNTISLADIDLLIKNSRDK